ncbi:hypothetical protein [Gracilibacillus kekensis]|uniref:Uncharacterized protein n=1 Tax=Gracilibacillus kekensis TaxID=1027249 RepID=A0A1M7P3R7_9BACI|nr:hypothetical protein [Gracilibacillus kekensis]SHN11209.1 hypothetical protein SAMN05216179_1964 [Gracilibacillus kekensis]
MDELFSFIVPILAVVFWLFGLSKSKEEENKQQQSQKPRQQNTPVTETRQPEPTQAPSYQTMETMSDSNQPTFSQQKEKQMEKLQEKIQRAETIRDQTKGQEMGIHDAIKDGPEPRAYRKNNNDDISLSVKNNLTQKGIAQGIIMAEVLGPPRAYQKRKSYRK